MNRLALLIGLGLLLLAGLFLWLKPGAEPAAKPAAETFTGPAAPIAPAAITFELTLHHGQLTSGPDTLRVTQGQTVTLQVLADQADELHLHGYDLSVQVQPGVPAELHFVAEHSGRFAIESHHAHHELAALEVLPP